MKDVSARAQKWELDAKADIRTARWLSNGLGAFSCVMSLLAWGIFFIGYAQLSGPSTPGPHGLTRNFHNFLGYLYVALALQAAALFFLVMAIIPSRNRLRTALFGIPIGACAFLLFLPWTSRVFQVVMRLI
jgi:hypothetical protein